MPNFDLHAAYDEASDALRLRVIDSPAGQTKQAIRSEALTPLWPEINLYALTRLDWNRLKEVGGALREMLLPGSIWGLWRESLGRAGAEGLRLRVRPADASAASLPWELIYDVERNEFPALNIDTPVVYYLEGPIPARPRTEQLPATLSVLLTGADSDSERPLDISTELDRVAAALRPLTDNGKASVTRIDALRAHRLQTALLQQKPHIFHFAGHGEWDADAQSGALLLVGEGDPDRLQTDFLATVLRGSSVKLVILNACDSAPDNDQLWSGMAQALVLAGLPAVVAMRTLVSDRAATAFAELFYTAVAAGEPLDRAMTHARQAVMGRTMNGEWLAPALFLRAGDARLWAEPEAKPTETTPGQGRQTVGGIHIGNVNATNFVTGDATINQRGSTFNVGGGSTGPSTGGSGADESS